MGVGAGVTVCPVSPCLGSMVCFFFASFIGIIVYSISDNDFFPFNALLFGLFVISFFSGIVVRFRDKRAWIKREKARLQELEGQEDV